MDVDDETEEIIINKERYGLILFKLKNESKIIKVILFSSCFILFSLIVFCAFYYGKDYNYNTSPTILGHYYDADNDDVKFIRSAKILAETGNYTYHKPPQATVFMMPGLSFTLAFLMKVFGEFGGITALRLLQGIIQVLSLLLIFFIGRKVFNSKVAIVAVILDVLCLSEIWVPNMVLTETFFKFFTLCLIYFSLWAIEEGKIKYYVLGGTALGFGALFRPTIVLYPAVILIIWIIKKVRFIDAVKYTAVVAVCFSIILSPWWIRNYSIFHRFIPLTMATGNPMVQGTAIGYSKYYMADDGLDYTNYNTHDPKLSEIERNDMEIALSKYRLKTLFPQEPLRYIYWYTVGKGWLQIKEMFYWREIFGINPNLAFIYHRVLLIIGSLGIILSLRRRRKDALVLLPALALGYFIVAYLPFFTMARYFYPIVPCLLIFAAYSIVSIGGGLQKLKIK